MADTAARNVVNGIQSVGDPTPIDAPENTQQSSRTGGGVGDEKEITASTIEQERLSQNTFPESFSAQTLRRTDNTHGIVQSGGSTTTQDRSSSSEPLDAALTTPNGNYTNDSLVEPSPISTDAELEWRRPSLPSQEQVNRGERSNSIKKPTAFKSVSVTKNFLAKSTAGVAPPSKSAPDKAASPSPTPATSQSSAKPRLVAKSVRDARPTPLPGQSGSNGPDASKVWNRNRPAPPPPPKQFTDEELKQQYGIHLATRLQSDEPGKGSKWADMEDDEDDWAPDTVEWMDGTKTSLQPSENQLSTPVERKQSPLKEETEDETKTSDSVQLSSSNIGPGKTILRPGARVNQNLTKPGLILKSVPENPTPPPKPTTNGSGKSPWAPLPPVDKVSPVTFNPPPPLPQPSSGLQRERPIVDTNGNLQLSSPTREIAADTFDRSWRSNDRGSRELFDAKSGRYEPARGGGASVGGGRRTSFRQEGGFRPPAVLQRPSQGEQDRSFDSQDARNFERRRSSMSTEDPSAFDRRSSADVPPYESYAHDRAARGDASPSQSLPSDTSRPDVNGSHRPYAAYPSDGGPQGPGVDGNSDVHMQQQQLMRQRIEANRRRKQEEQEREEAARQERIKQKLRALDATSPLSPKLDEKPKEFVDGRPEQLPTQESNREEMLTEAKSQHPVTTTESAPLSRSPISKGEVMDQPHLDGLGEIPPGRRGQHVPAPIPSPRAQPTSKSNGGSPGYQSGSLPSHPTPAFDNTQHLSDSASQAFKSHSDTSHLAPSEAQQLPSAQPPTPQTLDRPAHHWTSGPATHPSASWSTQSGHLHSLTHSNVWGPPSNDKALGNGAFESDFQRLPHIGYQPHQFRGSPGPIAPPSVSPQPTIPSRNDLHSSTANNMAQTKAIPSPTSTSFNMAPTPSSNGAAPVSNANGPHGQRQAFFPSLSRYTKQHALGGSNPFKDTAPINTAAKTTANITNSSMSEYASAWQTFSNNIEATERASREAKKAQEPHQGPAAPPDRRFEVTFQKVTGGDDYASRQIGDVKTYRSVDGTGQPHVQSPAIVASAAPAAKSSRFFGLGSDRVTPEMSNPVTSTAELIEPDGSLKKMPLPVSPPSPEAEGPLFGSYIPSLTSKATTSNVPKVKIPMPKATVKLPDASNYSESEPSTRQPFMMPSRLPSMSQPIVLNAAWQQRFNDLFDKAPDNQVAPAKPLNAAHALELKPRSTQVQPISKPIGTESELCIQPVQPLSASSPFTVLLPWINRHRYVKSDESAETKSTDGKVFDEPENGSRPRVVLASDIPSMDGSEETASQAFDRIHATSTKPAVAETARPLEWDDLDFNTRHNRIMNIAVKIDPRNTPGYHKSHRATSGGPSNHSAKVHINTSNPKARKSPWAKPPKNNGVPSRRH